MQEYKLDSIQSNKGSYQKIIDLYNQLVVELFLQDYELLFTGWFDAHLCAIVGAVFDKLKLETLSNITIKFYDSKIEDIFMRNQFLSYYGYTNKYHQNSTTIEYKKLRPVDGKYFSEYIMLQLINRKELLNLSASSKNKISRSISEIFNNAIMHSKTDFIYTCGQFYPSKKEIGFTIVDLGVGFKHNVNERFKANFTSEQAIRWAIKLNHTTKEITGGIGLDYLKDFMMINHGIIQIISGDGFYCFKKNVETSATFNNKFPGTIITMIFNTDDHNLPDTNSEVDIKQIF